MSLVDEDTRCLLHLYGNVLELTMTKMLTMYGRNKPRLLVDDVR